MDVSESNIAQVALEHGGVLIDDIIRAKIEITEKENTKGEIVKNYKVLEAVSYTHLRAHETGRNLVCRLLLEK